jgi:predicted protein tyrosine phosphatase
MSDVYEIAPNLYLGDFGAARTAYRDRFPTAFVVNATKDLAMLPEDAADGLRIPVDDNGTTAAVLGMLQALPAACDAIAAALAERRAVIVHCLAGQQRSPAVIAAYLMRERGWSPEEAVRFVRFKKPDAFFWSVNFQQTLELWAGAGARARVA